MDKFVSGVKSKHFTLILQTYELQLKKFLYYDAYVDSIYSKTINPEIFDASSANGSHLSAILDFLLNFLMIAAIAKYAANVIIPAPVIIAPHLTVCPAADIVMAGSLLFSVG